MKATLIKCVDVELDADDLAKAFCQLDDDAQAKFFVEVARVMGTWDVPAGRTVQAHYIGLHMSNCECSSEEAREFLRDIVAGFDQ